MIGGDADDGVPVARVRQLMDSRPAARCAAPDWKLVTPCRCGAAHSLLPANAMSASAHQLDAAAIAEVAALLPRIVAHRIGGVGVSARSVAFDCIPSARACVVCAPYCFNGNRC
eukprot:scaffold7927_cov296-Pinguiococcus_pyrenoidosus.AAC.5